MIELLLSRKALLHVAAHSARRSFSCQGVSSELEPMPALALTISAVPNEPRPS